MGEQLQWANVKNWREHAAVFGQADDVQAVARANVRVGVGEHD